MHIRKTIGAAALGVTIAVGASGGAQAATWGLDFDELYRGNVISNEFGQGLQPYASGVPNTAGGTIAGVKLEITARRSNWSLDQAVIFDSDRPTTGSGSTPGSNDGDPDLVGGGNLGNILIVQETNYGSGDLQPCGSAGNDHANCGGIIPDDQIGGYLIFDFSDSTEEVNLSEFTIVDNEEGNSWFRVGYADNSNSGNIDLPVTGNNGVGSYVFGGSNVDAEDISYLKVFFKGSGGFVGLGGFTSSTTPNTPVPEPASLLLLAGGLAGLAYARRRRDGASKA